MSLIIKHLNIPLISKNLDGFSTKNCGKTCGFLYNFLFSNKLSLISGVENLWKCGGLI